MACNCQEVAEKGKQKVEESLAMRLVQDTRKQSKRWFIAWLVTFLALLAVLGVIIYYVLTSEISVKNVDVCQDGYGINNYIGQDGDITNGATDTNTND